MRLAAIKWKALTREAWARVLQGRWASLIALTLFGLAVMGFLFATVHRRNLNEDLTKWYVYSAADPDRYPRLIRFWIEQGYLKHGGLWFILPGDIGYIDEAHPRVYQSGSMGFLQAAHLMERISYAVRGKFSYLPWMVHNQAIVWASSTLLGLLAMRLALRLAIRPLPSLALGAACLVVYQTFPVNLWYYWEILSTTAAALFIILFLLIEEILFDRAEHPRWLIIVRSLGILGLVLSEWIAGFFLIVAYVLARLILTPDSRPVSLKGVLLPAGAGWAVYGLQLAWVRWSFPQVEFVGGNFMFRTGLDGATDVYYSHLDLIARRTHFYLPYLEPILQPWFLFVTGGLAVVLVAGLYLTRLPELRSGLVALAIGLSVYFFYVFLFSQSGVIHPYMYDALLVIPLILALMALLPASLERLTRHMGVWTLATLVLAFCLAMVQLRTYATAFPLPNLPSGW